ncbi:hypothetical protein ABZR86_21570 [Dyella marensis]|uniref:Ceramidase n=1 Tax=Dyella marensis TaxID=500610 RepID=A0A1I2IW96_9GAMM|nr:MULTISPECIES: hypothetical protein [Dyella]SFF45978.1 Ceramidase [Dyella marensis]
MTAAAAGAGIEAARRRARMLALAGIVLAIVALALPPMAQPQSYHGFADQRGWLGIPNFGDVMSNLAFLAVGLMGLAAMRLPAVQAMGRTSMHAYGMTFAGLALTAFGSAYYHWAPSDARLVWDRLPMTLVFMPLLAATLAERLRWRSDQPLLALSLLGVGTVVYWKLTGNLLPYFAAEGGSILLLLLAVALLPTPWSGRAQLFAVLATYLVAFACEQGDKLVFQATGGNVSGHTIKHLVAALAFYVLLRMLRRQRLLTDSDT